MATSAAGLLQWVTDEHVNHRSRWTFADARPVGSRQLGLAGWKQHRRTGVVYDNPSTRPHGPFRELQLGCTPADEGPRLLDDSVMVLDGLVSPCECATMISAANTWCDKHQTTGALRRMECHIRGVNLDGNTHALAHIILSRVLWHIECLEPELAAKVFPEARARHLADMQFEFSGQEPMMNRYTEGGMFEPHQDGYALTVLVPLSMPDEDFSGGGTAFWSDSIASDASAAKSCPPSLVMRPPAGTGLFWRGHITHAGLPVLSGSRHVFVASFDLS